MMARLTEGPGATLANGKPVAFHCDGQGKVLIFVHGMLADHGIWDCHAPEFSGRYQVIRPTLSYFGASQWLDAGEGFYIDAFADELGTFISSLELNAPTLIGWSFGGAVCLSLAARMPELVGDLLLYEPSLATAVNEPLQLQAIQDSREEMFGMSKSIFLGGNLEGAAEAFIDGVNGRTGTYSNLPDIIRKVHARNARTMGPFFSDPPQPSITPDMLATVSQRVTLLLGQESCAFWQIAVPALAERLPNAQLRRIAGARHMWPSEAPIAFAQELLQNMN